MTTYPYPLQRSRSSSRHRKRLVVWTMAVILAAGTGYMAGKTIQAIHGETIATELREQVQDLTNELRYYRSMPAVDRV